MDLHIRPEQPADISAIHEVNLLAFGQPQEAVLVDKLRHDEAFIPELSLVAITADEIVGYILFTRIHIEDAQGKVQESLALAPVAVRPEWQHQGIGSRLIKEGLARARTLGHTSVIVLGHAHFYPRFGFVPAAKWGIRAPFEVPSEVFMGTELEAGALENVSGTVRYAKPFEGV